MFARMLMCTGITDAITSCTLTAVEQLVDEGLSKVYVAARRRRIGGEEGGGGGPRNQQSGSLCVDCCALRCMQLHSTLHAPNVTAMTDSSPKPMSAWAMGRP